ncbi:DUF5801 domain-containing protein [Desulfomicrobium sp. ZS1]|uniref:DUF5801 repeats-in-toxin domain-containing protein n=1 Tax=Desulfomicrobium sp. ZS1 TaxID=2952228 RepID=UPI0020B1A265|nr:DUF5801 repeats-in-toxin domain-containing protein [Desulfomicrobium sp. ZS1]UTF50308.1 DUF5801 domain-containing protein [Desulfomicrobium sp. ZS1]
MAESQNSKQNVQAPQAGQTVIVNAIPGQDIVLEAAFDQAEVKMDGGNVVFEFANGGQVVLDFTDLGEAQAPNVVMPDGTVLNMQEFLASFGEGDIEPAAGPEGGADGSGGVGEYRDDAGNLIEGVDKLGVLNPREFTSISVEALDADPLLEDALLTPETENPLPTAGNAGGAVDEDGLRIRELRISDLRMTPFNGNNDEADGDHPAEDAFFVGTLEYDFGGDGPAATSPFEWSMDGLVDKGITSRGYDLQYEVVDGGLTLNAFYVLGEGDPEGPSDGDQGGDFSLFRVVQEYVRVDVFSVQVTDLASGAYRFELYQPLDHPESTEDDIVYNFGFVVADGSGDTAVGGLNILVDDDSPLVSVDADVLPRMILDESLSEENTVAGDGDGVHSLTEDFSSYFSFSYGADGPQSEGSVNYSLSLNGKSVASGIFAVGENGQHGAPIMLSLDGNGAIIGTVGESDPYFRISVDAETGTVTFEQFQNVWHDNPEEDDEAVYLTLPEGTILLEAVAADGDLDTASATIDLSSGVFGIQDDGPSIDIEKTEGTLATLVASDATLGTNPTANFAGNFTTIAANTGYGADGEGSVSSLYSLGVKSEGADSGLVDTATGAAVVLTFNAITGAVEGHADTVSGALVFTVSVDSSTGEVTLDQVRAVQHDDASDPVESGTSAATLTSSDLITLTRTDTITDGDGDTDSDFATLNIGSAISFEDDGPSIDIEKTEGTLATLVASDATLSTNPTANFAGNFTTIAANTGYGADGEGSVSSLYSLGVKSEGADSGLVDTATGAAVVLTFNAITGAVEGHADTVSGALVFTVSVDSSTGEVTLDQVRAVQHDDASDPVESGTSAATLTSSDLITLTRTDTITDGDGDTDSDFATLNIGSAISFEDDGPSIDIEKTEGTLATLVASDATLSTNPTANFAGNFTTIAANTGYGADGEGSVSSLYSLGVKSEGADSGLVDTATGAAVVLTFNAITGAVEGHADTVSGALVFTVSVDSSTGEVTLDQVRAVQHDDASDPVESGTSAATLTSSDLITLTRTDTITDGDGDTDSDFATLNIGSAISFEDDGPSIDIEKTEGTLATLVASDATLSTNPTANFAGNFTTIAANTGYGADGEGSVSSLYSLGVKSEGADSGLVDTATGAAVVLTFNAITGAVEGHADTVSGALVFTVSVDSSTGEVTLDQVRAVQHDDASDPVESGTSAATLTSSDLITLTRTDTITDGDGDTDSDFATLNIGSAISFEDDGPSIDIEKTEGTLATLVASDATLSTNPTANFAGNFTTIAANTGYGADGEGSVSSLYSLGVKSEGADSGLVDTATGAAVVLTFNAITGAVEGHADTVSGALVFTVSVDSSTGEVTLDQVRAVQHDDASDPVESGTSAATLTSSDLITLTRTDTITDGDGDTDSDFATLNIGSAISFEDDGPSIDIEKTEGTLATLVASDATLSTNPTANFAGNFTTIAANTGYGADGEGSVSSLYSLGVKSEGADSGLVDTATGAAVVLTFNAITGAVEGHADTVSGALVFTVSVDSSTGEVTLDQVRAVQHDDASDPVESGTSAATLTSSDLITLTRTDTITDGDGDTDSDFATLNIGSAISFEDDGPEAALKPDMQVRTLLVDESAVPNPAENPVDDDGIDDGIRSASADFSGYFADLDFGTDGAGSVGYAVILTGTEVGSGLYAVDPEADGGKGEQIFLRQAGDVVEGYLGDQVYFTIKVDSNPDSPTFNHVVFTQVVSEGVSIWHAEGGTQHDDLSSLVVAPGDGEVPNALNLVQTVKDADGDVDSAELNLGSGVFLIEDDGPTAGDVSREFVEQLPVYISGFQAGFVNGDGKSTLNYVENDSDSYADGLFWGVTSSNTGSGYLFEDNDELRDFSDNVAGQTFTLGTFTHVNKTIAPNTSLNSVDLIVKFMLNGREVSHTVTLIHDETTNGGNADQNRDIITLLNTTLTKQFVIDGQTFELKIDGFKQVGEETDAFSTAIKTYEGQNNPFELVASISPVNSPVISGTVNPGYGTDGPGEVIWDEIEYNDEAGAYVSTSDYGTFTGYSDGSYNFVQSSYDVNEPVKLDFAYTVTDGDNDTDSAVLSLTVTDASEVVAHDNYGQAMIEEFDGEEQVVIPALADFKNWAQNQIIRTDVESWGRTSANDTVRNSDGSLRMTDGNDSSNNYSVVVSKGLVIRDTADVIKFEVEVSNVHSQATTTDEFSWKIYKLVGTDWVSVSGVGGIVPETDGFVVKSITGLDAGRYRLEFIVNDKTKNDSSDGIFYATIKNITVSTTVDVDDILVYPVIGNVITDPNDYIASTDPWGAQDRLGSEGAFLSFVNGIAVATTGITTINGDYGTLEISADGSYTYTPNEILENLGMTDVFVYTLTQPDGDLDTAQLVITIAETPYTPPVPIVVPVDGVYGGSDGNDVILGFSGDDVLMGGDGNDRLEGGDGDDTLMGGAGDDILLGGDGEDILIGGAGDDIMLGGGGSDTFKFGLDALDGGYDQILDFQLGENGDQLDLSGVFGESGLDLKALQDAGYVKVEVDSSDSSKLNVHVDADGSAGNAGGTVDISVSVTGDLGDNAVETMLSQINTEL